VLPEYTPRDTAADPTHGRGMLGVLAHERRAEHAFYDGRADGRAQTMAPARPQTGMLGVLQRQHDREEEQIEL